MSKKSLLSAFVLLAGTFLSTPSFAQTADAGCASCVAPTVAPFQMAQMMPSTALPAPMGTRSETTTRSDDPKGQSILRTCCDPELGRIPTITLFGPDFAAGSNFAANYGWLFLPTPAFSTAMNNTAFIANVMAMVPNSLLVMTSELRTDNNAALGSSSPWDASLFSGYWASFSVPIGSPFELLAIWDSNPANVLGTNWGKADPYVRTAPTVAPAHMRTDGTRYIAKITYWLYYRVPGTDQWVRSKVICNNLADQYMGTRINASSFRLAPGGGMPSGTFLSQSVSADTQAGMRVGAAIPLTPAEINAIPSNLRR